MVEISWVKTWDLENQCGICSETVEEGKLVGCLFGQKEFPRATHCPKFKYEMEDDE